MPEYNDPVARNALKQMQRELDKLKAQVARLSANANSVTLPRLPVNDLSQGSTYFPTVAEIPNPYEGQVILGQRAGGLSAHAYGFPFVFAEGAWQPLGGLAMAWLRRDDTVPTVTETKAMPWDRFTTNAPEIFKFDPDNPDRLTIPAEGQFMVGVSIDVSDLGVAKSIYLSTIYDSYGSLPFGNELELAVIGSGQTQYGLGATNGVAVKSRLTAMSWFELGSIFGSARENPWHLYTVLQREGTDWNVSATGTSNLMYVVRLGPSFIYKKFDPADPFSDYTPT